VRGEFRHGRLTTELLEECRGAAGVDVIIVKFTVTAEIDNSTRLQDCQMVADRRLALIQRRAEGRHGLLPVLRENGQNMQPLRVRQDAEEIGEFAESVVRHGGTQGQGVTVKLKHARREG
jgi:hypothetical protein